MLRLCFSTLRRKRGREKKGRTPQLAEFLQFFATNGEQDDRGTDLERAHPRALAMMEERKGKEEVALHWNTCGPVGKGQGLNLHKFTLLSRG